VESLIAQFGYAAIVVATAIEGGTALTIGGFLAHRGYLELFPGVVGAGILGNALDGQLWFFLGRRYGLRLVARRSEWKNGLDRVDSAFRRYPSLLIVGGRFVPGTRTLGWIAAGLSTTPRGKFALLNVLGATLWATTVAGLGYLFGDALERVLGELKHLELPIVIGIAAAGGLWWLVARVRSRRRSQPART